MERIKCHEWEDAEDKQEEWMSQSAQDEGGRHTKEMISIVGIDGSLKGTSGKYAISNEIVQLCFDHGDEPKHGECGKIITHKLGRSWGGSAGP